MILPKHVRILAKQPDGLEQEIAEIRGVERLETLLIGGIELEAAPKGETRGLASRHFVRGEPAVLPIIDQARQRTRRPLLLVDILGFEHLLHQTDLIVGVEDGEGRLEVDELGMTAQDLHPDGVKGPEPRHALDHLADHPADPLLHLARRLVGEGDGEDLGRSRAPEAEDVGDAGGQHPCLAGPGAGEHQQRAVKRLDRKPLLGIEPGKIRRCGAGARPRGDAARGGCRQGSVDVARKLAGFGHSGVLIR